MAKEESIQEALENLGFIVNGENFVKADVVIPFSELSGHTVSSFLEKARRRGWIEDLQAIGL